MKLTDKIKDKIDNARSKEEVKTVLENSKDGAGYAGSILSDEDLEKVSGSGIFVEIPRDSSWAK